MFKLKVWLIRPVILSVVSIAFLFFGCSQKGKENLFNKEEAVEKILNFSLIDQEGEFHRLSYYNNYDALVLFVQGNGCPIVRNSFQELENLQKKFEGRKVKFLMVNSNIQDSREKIKAEAEEFNVDIPILVDNEQLVANMLNLRVTAETLLIDLKSRDIIYRGPISDRLDYESQKQEAKNNYLSDAIEKFFRGENIENKNRKATGCAITRVSDSKLKEITYTEQIAPILEQKCVSCHQVGGIAPWAMTDYNMVKGWSAMIKNVIQTKRMPPWQADPNYGHFSNDISLTTAEVQDVLRWIDADIPRGNGDDILATIGTESSQWKLGKPDYEIDLKPEKIPATGIIDYRYQAFEIPIDSTIYLKGVEILADRSEILHHVLATIQYPKDYVLPLDRKRGPWIDGIMAAWAPGTAPEVFPEGTGRIIPKGSKIHFQLHYTTNGKEVEDRSKIGLHFWKSAPEKEYITIGPSDFDLVVLPNDANHFSTITEKIYEDIRIYSFFPHMHYRGKSMKYILERPDGERETLISVPNYNFNWQRQYWLQNPIDVKKGSKLIVEARFDNSLQNRFNPSAQDTVRFGEQTKDEMMIGFFSYHKQ